MRIVALAILAIASSSAALAADSSPDAMLNMQRKVQDFYYDASNLDGRIIRENRNLIKLHMNEIDRTINSLSASKNRFKKQLDSQPTNVYSVLNGVWELTGGNAYADCTDGDRIPLTFTVQRTRLTFQSNGVGTAIPLEITTIPGTRKVWETESIKADASSATLRWTSTTRWWSDWDGYHTVKEDWVGQFSSENHVTGFTNGNLYFESYDVTCYFKIRVTANKVGK